MSPKFLTIVLVFLSVLTFGATWNYDQQGDDWGSVSPFCESKEYSTQSPIDIKPDDTVVDKRLRDFTFSSEWQDNVATGDVENNGHTYQFNDATGLRKVSGGGLYGEYTFLQLHFHFGSAAFSSGSEHTVDGKRYPAEVHFVMQNNDDFWGNETGNLAVLGFFIEIDDSEPINGGMATILSKITSVIDEDVLATTAANGDVNLAQLPNNFDLSKYYRYLGSLTTPDCNPVVVWTVFKEPLKFSQAQYDIFIGGVDDADNAIENTYRNIQPVNKVNRIVYQSPGTYNVGDDNVDNTLRSQTLAILILGPIIGAVICLAIVALIVVIVLKGKAAVGPA